MIFVIRSKPFRISILVLALLAAAYLFYLCRIDKDLLLMPDNHIFFDRNSEMLRFLPDKKGERHIWVSIKDVPNMVRDAFISAEDRKFYIHYGFDPIAILRAGIDNIENRRIVSGASTITQQVVRLIYPRKRRYKDKFIEILRSAYLESIKGKEEILEQYLNRVPLGNNIVGIELASKAYFGKSSKNLTPSEAAILAALPKSPGYLNPYGKNIRHLIKRRGQILSVMRDMGYLTEDAYKEAITEEPVFKRFEFPNDAPHLVDRFIKNADIYSSPKGYVTTIDINIQKGIEDILRSHETRLSYKGAFQSAAMIIHNPTMEVLASVGSILYGSKNKGYNNGTISLRSAGSTLKPFVYALAVEDGYSVTWLLEDILKQYKTPEGGYSPANYDRNEYGPVTMRTALGNSLNISAIKMLEQLGQRDFYNLLKEINLINDPSKSNEYYGLGLVIGNPEVSLEQLTASYAIFANNGRYSPVKYLLDDGKKESGKKDESGKYIFSPQTAYIISDILSDPSARILTFGNIDALNFPFKVSVKTGTSTKYRDGWSIGFTPEYTVGVWAGNFEGTPTYSISGAEGASPILKDIMTLLYKRSSPPITEQPKEVVSARVCGMSGMKPSTYCSYVTTELFITGTEPDDVCKFHTKNKEFHNLPVSYASWLYEKDKKGIAGGYRLSGFSDELSDLFSDSGSSQDMTLKGERPLSVYSKISSEDNDISIVYPLVNDKFIMGRGISAQTIRLEAVLSRPAKYVDWFIDGMHYRRAAPPYYAEWRLEKGRHDITAVTPDNIGDSVDVVVE